MASQIQTQSFHDEKLSKLPIRQGCEYLLPDGIQANSPQTLSGDPAVLSIQEELCRAAGHCLEFVARPGSAEQIQAALPEAIRYAVRSSRNFAGFMILVSEQEARLLTVITLWKGAHNGAECDEYAERMREVLKPCVDRWLRAQRFGAFLTLP